METLDRFRNSKAFENLRGWAFMGSLLVFFGRLYYERELYQAFEWVITFEWWGVAALLLSAGLVTAAGIVFLASAAENRTPQD